MKVVFIGCVDFSFTILTSLVGRADIEFVGVVTRNTSKFNADFRSLEPIATDNNIPLLIVDGNDQDKMGIWIKDRTPDLIICVGWSYLLSKNILLIPHKGVVGYHPAPLPRGRGRHPIIWAIALGLEETASTFFFMDTGADSGDIINTRSLPIYSADTAGTVYEALKTAATDQIQQIVDALLVNTLTPCPQDDSKATYWRKRGRQDGQIDWRMSARVIHNLVRALTHPYVGAHCIVGGCDVKIWSTAIVDSTKIDAEPGKILAADGTRITVKCGEGAIDLLEHEMQTNFTLGDYL